MPPTKPENQASSKPRRRSIYASETVGLLLIAFVLLILTLIRYWRYIHWSWH